MPPKKSAAAAASAGEGQGSTLKLIIEKGPLSGTTREFMPGVTVRIGRVVRGNTLSIKDDGISSKHILIQSDTADGRRWTVADLDSSNGTILNGVELEPSKPAVLSHGDVIKIGELTSMRVEMLSEPEIEVASGVRRNARRRVRADLVKIDEDAELGLRNKGDNEKIEVEAKQGRSVNTRSAKISAKNVNLAKDLNVEEDKEFKGSRGVSTRRTRSSKMEENVEEIVVDLSVIEGKKRTGGGRGRKKLFVETVSEETDKEEPNTQHETHEEEKERSEAGVDEPGLEVKSSVTEGLTAGATSSAGIDEPGLEVKSSVTEGLTAGATSSAGIDVPGIEVNNSVTEGVAAGASSSAAVQDRKLEGDKGKKVVDLEKMTLGEWLDYLEEYLPQQIIAETEEMLDEMRRKAERCHEYMLEQKKKKAQGS